METKANLEVLSKDEQKAVAVDIFNRHPKAQKVSVASDGQAFITDVNDAAAKNHAKNNRYKKELELTPFTRDGVDEKKSEIQQNDVKDALAEIEAATTSDEVNEIIDGCDIAEVLAAAAAKLETLNIVK